MYVDGMVVNEYNRNIVFVCVCVCVRCACIQEHSSMCGWCLLVKTACTYLPCGHVIGAVCSDMWCACVRVCMCECMQVCAAHPENTPDALHFTNSSCRDWLWLRLDRQSLRKLMSESPNCSSTSFRCCAVAKLEDTLDHSSVVGYKCKAIQ